MKWQICLQYTEAIQSSWPALLVEVNDFSLFFLLFVLFLSPLSFLFFDFPVWDNLSLGSSEVLCIFRHSGELTLSFAVRIWSFLVFVYSSGWCELGQRHRESAVGCGVSASHFVSLWLYQKEDYFCLESLAVFYNSGSWKFKHTTAPGKIHEKHRARKKPGCYHQYISSLFSFWHVFGYIASHSLTWN